MKRFLIALIFAVLIPVGAAAYEAPRLDGEDGFNETVVRAANGELSLDPIKILNFAVDSLTKEIKDSAAEIVVLLSAAAMSGTVSVLTASFGEKGSGETAFFACFTLMSAAALRCFNSALSCGTAAVETMSMFTDKLSPLLMLVLAACGKVTSANTFQPVFSASVYVISLILKHCLVPLITFGAVLSVAGNINGRVQISSFTRVVRSLSKWLMAAVITIFTGISAVYGFSAPVLDAVGAKALKFAVGSMVPVVGTFLSDTLETVVSGTRIMKNAVGISGIITLFGMCSVPIIKITVIQLILKLAAAVSEPLTDVRISKMLWGISEAVTSVFAVVVMTAVLFMLNIGIIIAATGGT